MSHLFQADGLTSLSINFFGFSAQADGACAIASLALICVTALVTRVVVVLLAGTRERPKRWG